MEHILISIALLCKIDTEQSLSVEKRQIECQKQLAKCVLDRYSESSSLNYSVLKCVRDRK